MQVSVGRWRHEAVQVWNPDPPVEVSRKYRTLASSHGCEETAVVSLKLVVRIKIGSGDGSGIESNFMEGRCRLSKRMQSL
jgi:hypothetical protein